MLAVLTPARLWQIPPLNMVERGRGVRRNDPPLQRRRQPAGDDAGSVLQALGQRRMGMNTV